MRSNVILFFFIFFLLPKMIFGQNQRIHQKFELLKEQLSILMHCYEGNKLKKRFLFRDKKVRITTTDELIRIKNKALGTIKDFDNIIKGKYPVYFDIVEHIEIALRSEAFPNEACLALLDASQGYSAIDSLSVQLANTLKSEYSNYLGIDRGTFDILYNSVYCKLHGIAFNENCQGKGSKVKKVDEIPEIPEKPIEIIAKPNITIVSPSGSKISLDSESNKYVFKNDSNKSIDADELTDLLRKALSRDLLNSKYLQITQLFDGDNRIIPGQKGVPYEVKFKHDDTFKTLYFDPGKYIIEDGRTESTNQWKNYNKALTEFKNLVLMILDDYGNDAFNIFIQGSADNLQFKNGTDRSLYKDFNGEMFKRIVVWSVNKKLNQVELKTVNIGQEFDNNELPNLRGVFVKSALLKIDRFKKFPNQLHVLEGYVKNKIDTKERNCIIYIYIDWDKATNLK